MLKLLNREHLTGLPDAVLFDLDNTLYAYDPAHEQALCAVREKAVRMLSIEAAVFDKVFSEARSQIKHELLSTGSSHSRLLYFQRMLELMGLGSQILMALDFDQTYWQTFFKHAVLFDGVKELLDDLRLLGIQTAIVTDLMAQIQFRKLIYLGLDPYFEYIVTSEEAGQDKPDAKIFQLALEKMKFKGSTLWMVGDNPINDILGARKQVNAVTFQKIHAGVTLGTGDHQPDVVFHHFSELRRLLVRLEERNFHEEESVTA